MLRLQRRVLGSATVRIDWALETRGRLPRLLRPGQPWGEPWRGPEHRGRSRFDGRDDFIEVPVTDALNLGKQDFSIAVWVHTEADLSDVLGDILSQYDPATRTGFTFSLLNSAGVTSSQSNYRNLSFGIDAGRVDQAWTDRGRPGNARFVMAMAVYDGQLYVGTYEEGENEAGHVYRYEDGATWIDCGSPDKANAIGSLAVYQGRLYAGSARYNAQGSLLVKSPNWQPGGRVYCFEGGQKWTDCGKLGEANEVIGMAVFQGKLYATPLYQDGKGLYGYEGGQQWTHCGDPGRRVQPLFVYNGACTGAAMTWDIWCATTAQPTGPTWARCRIRRRFTRSPYTRASRMSVPGRPAPSSSTIRQRTSGPTRGGWARKRK